MSAPERRAGTEAVHAAVERFWVTQDSERLRLYRLHLQAAIRSVSPLAVDLASQAAVTLYDVALMLPVPPRWPIVGRGFSTSPWFGRGAARRNAQSRKGTMPKVGAETGRWLGDRGVAVRGRAHVRGDLGFVPMGGVLETVATFSDAFLHTSSGDAWLRLRRAFPETALAASVGRAMRSVVDHPVLVGQDYLIVDAYSDDFDGCAVLKFRTGLRRHELPWRAELDAEIAAEGARAIAAAALMRSSASSIDCYVADQGGRNGEVNVVGPAAAQSRPASD